MGSVIVREMKASGHEATIVTRNPMKVSSPSVGWEEAELVSAVNTHDVVLNLVGQPLMEKRWNAEFKQLLWESRVGSTAKIVDAMEKASSKPNCFINASSLGYYGPRGSEPITENDPGGDDFLAKLCKRWEKEALRAKGMGIRTALVRIGIVLGLEGGALSRMVTPFKLGLGGPMGSGRQYMSWVHILDVARLFVYITENQGCEGIFNGTAPNAVDNREFAKTLGKVIGKPAFLPVPGFALKLAMGEVVQILLTGQNLVPQKALDAGFEFSFPHLEEALQDLVV